MEQKPSIGRVVHYQRYGSPGGEHKAEPSPAVITKINDEATGQCQLFVMNPNGLYFNDTPYSGEAPDTGDGPLETRTVDGYSPGPTSTECECTSL